LTEDAGGFLPDVPLDEGCLDMGTRITHQSPGP
jgi:hypothetical protein